MRNEIFTDSSRLVICISLKCICAFHFQGKVIFIDCCSSDSWLLNLMVVHPKVSKHSLVLSVTISWYCPYHHSIPSELDASVLFLYQPMKLVDHTKDYPAAWWKVVSTMATFAASRVTCCTRTGFLQQPDLSETVCHKDPTACDRFLWDCFDFMSLYGQPIYWCC